MQRFIFLCLLLFVPLLAQAVENGRVTVKTHYDFQVEVLAPAVAVPRRDDAKWPDHRNARAVAVRAVSAMMRGDVQKFLALYHPEERKALMGKRQQYWQQAWRTLIDDHIDLTLTRRVAHGDMVLFEVSGVGQRALFDLPLIGHQTVTGAVHYYVTDQLQHHPVTQHWRSENPVVEQQGSVK